MSAQVSFNPTNGQWLVAIAAVNQALNLTVTNGNTTEIESFANIAILVASSRNRGGSWSATFVNFSALIPGNPVNIDLPFGTFDKFGNYWAIVTNADPITNYYVFAILVSIDNGQTFTYVDTISFAADQYGITDVDIQAGGTGVDNNVVVYVTGTAQMQLAPYLSTAFLCALDVSALGAYTTPIDCQLLETIQPAPDSNNTLVTQTQLIVRPSGTVSLLGVVSSVLVDQFISANANCSYLFDLNLGLPGFITGNGNYAQYALYNVQNRDTFPSTYGPLQAFTSTLGANNGVGHVQGNLYNFGQGLNFLAFTTGIFANTGAFSVARRAMAFDPRRNITWLAYCDTKPPIYQGNFTAFNNASMNIYVISSHNDGLTWSNQRTINTCKKNARALPTIAVDSTTNPSTVQVCFYDQCNDVTNTGAVQYVCAGFPSVHL